MKTVKFYKTDTEKKDLMTWGTSQGLILVEDAVTMNGKYLVFDVVPPTPMPVPDHIRVRNKVNELIDRIKEKIPTINIDKL